MIRRMLKRDFSQNNMIIVILFMFIMLSTLLMASASSMVGCKPVQFNGSII